MLADRDPNPMARRVCPRSRVPLYAPGSSNRTGAPRRTETGAFQRKPTDPVGQQHARKREVENTPVMTTIDIATELMNPFTVTGEIGGHPITLETGRLAQQAHGSVTITCGETILLATAVMSEQARDGIDFLPLTVEFEERLYAVGKIPGSFFPARGPARH